MSRPKFFRDPLHLQIRFDLSELPGPMPQSKQASASLLRIIDTPEFQRLRFIRQNGLANLVFHGAEHSRFTHSLGVMHVASTMYERITRNMSETEENEIKLCVQVASLVHDVGHGPFSHTLEEILKENDINFHHETMTQRFICEDTSSIANILKSIGSDLPDRLVAFFDSTKRRDEHWSYRLVSSQMDADRLDYVQRDALFARLRGHGFDIERVFDLLYHHNNSIAVDRGAIEAVEAYLVTIDQLYRAVYYHHAVRAATQMLLSLFRRAVCLKNGGDASIFPAIDGQAHPISLLLSEGDKIALRNYARLTDFSVWQLIEQWQFHSDNILSDLSRGIMTRKLLKTLPIDPSKFSEFNKTLANSKQITEELLGKGSAEYYIMIDEPSRTSYKGYDWRPDTPDESIWLIGGGKSPAPLEDEDNEIVHAFKRKKHFQRLILPAQVRQQLTS